MCNRFIYASGFLYLYCISMYSYAETVLYIKNIYYFTLQNFVVLLSDAGLRNPAVPNAPAPSEGRRWRKRSRVRLQPVQLAKKRTVTVLDYLQRLEQAERRQAAIAVREGRRVSERDICRACRWSHQTGKIARDSDVFGYDSLRKQFFCN